MKLTVISPPAGEALSLDAAKAYLRLSHSGEDDVVNELIMSARAQLEQVSGLALVSRQLRLTWTSWPPGLGGRGVYLSPGPAQAILSVRVVDEMGTETDQTGRFELQDGRLCLQPWSVVPSVPLGGHVLVEFETGFGAPGNVPEDFVLALKRLVYEAYLRREGDQAVPGLPGDVEAILDAHLGARL